MGDPNGSDPDLRLLQANDARAWEAAYEILHGLGQKAIRLDGSRHAADREDIVMDTIISVMNGITTGRFTDWEHVRRSFLWKLPLQKLDFFRKLYRNKEDLYDPAKLPEPVADGAALAQMTWEELDLLIEMLDPERRRRVFRHIYADGLTTREVTERFGIPFGTVTADLARGYKTLRELIRGR